ncbi:MAG: transglutaminase family protein [Deltaproteobacteria bacterium]
MLFLIRHRSEYTYSQPVRFKPHFLRFRPRENPFQELLSYKLAVSPEPVSVSYHLDSDGSVFAQARFWGEYYSLIIQSTAVVRASAPPSGWLIYPESACTLPIRYPSEEAEYLLKPYLRPKSASSDVARFAEGLAEESRWQTRSFLENLGRRINREFQNCYREMGEPYPPQRTLSEKSGSCRDFAVLFMSACRLMGIAARFVSGYQFDESSEFRDLHAWVEVYLPGEGWRGFDPSVEGEVTERHIAVAASADPRMTAPVSGIFMGNAEARLNVDLTITPF